MMEIPAIELLKQMNPESIMPAEYVEPIRVDSYEANRGHTDMIIMSGAYLQQGFLG